MTPAEKKLAVYLLDMVSHEYAKNGCNELDLVKEVGLTPEESLHIRQQIQLWAGDRDAPNERPDDHITMDWLAMRFMRDLIRQG